ncbi:hypothetical protein HKX48_007980 [Thoreauomyces humboldtii]|nr:hypothetical protein HKX48_007980 [Thoreauomyces humboldtii]
MSATSVLPEDEDVEEARVEGTEEDTEAWMEVDAEALEKVLEREGGVQGLGEEDWEPVRAEGGMDSDEELSDMDADDERDMRELAKVMGGFEAFVDKESGIDGVLFPGQSEIEEEENNDVTQEVLAAENSKTPQSSLLSRPKDPASTTGKSSAAKSPPLHFDESMFMQSMIDFLGIKPSKIAQMTKERNGTSAPTSGTDGIFSFTQTEEQIEAARFAELAASSSEDSGSESEVDIKPRTGKLEEYMSSMDAELAHTKVGASFEKFKSTASPGNSEEDTNKPIDLDLNLVTNLLQSFEAQEGLPGPAGTLLGGLGLNIGRPRKESKKA